MSGKKKNKTKKAKRTAQAEALSLINQVARNARTALSRHLLDLGLYAGQDGVMLALDGNDGQTPGAIAASLGVKAPTITKTIGRLAAQGFVRREGSKEDGRMMLVFLTDAGRDQIKSVRKSQRRTEKAAFADLKEKDVAHLLDLLAKVDAGIAADLRSGNAVPNDRTLDPETLEPQESDLPIGNSPVPETD
ncbi:MAG: MarR family transcriptional regulator [Hoeflea sp.]|uniref:MarR family winged helix-turn-helix transcriptional regulator n=1 Tax=Hoeflea sp. TaxID=1940281 RepID=UPI001DDC573D|nr:MarR family transcriptional regulator [Hoeflea sp.]MBU4528186.1 MarR family transcriptional regulator [Alphaproteobacteria bacterium]MBU4543782.1 MarR family transcriptional regulator [Alphaproteobacteria bacterium]MBU4548649.1 MarR family transcriptional regulator [Alphaproteobacteria bacterium]MBV1725815.1 MarR family transcriptional regulator [Hoeflea sp.]MBV1762171.1 MarR family transcriptional regulator [Hoeflea sp.]